MTSMNKSFEVIMRIDPYYMDNGKEQCFKGKGIQELIRCKDCKHRRHDGYCTILLKNVFGVASQWFVPTDGWFCADGERRTDE